MAPPALLRYLPYLPAAEFAVVVPEVDLPGEPLKWCMLGSEVTGRFLLSEFSFAGLVLFLYALWY